VIEILSASDAWSELLVKLDDYLRNGATYAVAIDPLERRHAVRGTSPAGFALDPLAIADA